MGFRQPEITAAEDTVLGGYTGSAAELNKLDGISVLTAEYNYMDTTAGTGAASKCAILDSGDDYTMPSGGDLTYNGTLLTATGAEITRACDMSAKVVAVTSSGATLGLTEAAHADRYLYIADATGTINLPAASGTGNKYTVILKIAATGMKIAANGTDGFTGGLQGVKPGSPDLPEAFAANAADDNMQFNGVATGGTAGNWVSFHDVESALWVVEGFFAFSGGSEATPFSAT